MKSSKKKAIRPAILHVCAGNLFASPTHSGGDKSGKFAIWGLRFIGLRDFSLDSTSTPLSVTPFWTELLLLGCGNRVTAFYNSIDTVDALHIFGKITWFGLLYIIPVIGLKTHCLEWYYVFYV